MTVDLRCLYGPPWNLHTFSRPVMPDLAAVNTIIVHSFSVLMMAGCTPFLKEHEKCMYLAAGEGIKHHLPGGGGGGVSGGIINWGSRALCPTNLRSKALAPETLDAE